MTKFIKSLVLPAAILISGTLTSCTLSEPDNNAANNPAEEMLLQKISSMGVNMLYITYDELNRPLKLSSPMLEEVVTLTYEGTDKYPSEMDIKQYDEESLDEHGIFTDIRFDANGHITSFTCKEWMQREQTWDISYNVLHYDNAGHLTESYVDGELSSWYEWEDGLLVKSHLDDGNDVYTWAYGNLENPTGMWSLNWPFLDILQITGWFGKAPSKLPISITERSGVYDEWYNETTLQFAYSLSTTGLITAEKFSDGDGDVVTLNYSYTKKR